jgi:Domain of unknown function (DUF4266)
VNGGRRTVLEAVGGWRLAVRRMAAFAAPSEGQRSTVNGQPTARAPRALLLAPLLLAATGCGNIEPWVKPYERQQLADPIMSFDPNPISTSYTHHVFEAREGARGALGSAGGGCGCN